MNNKKILEIKSKILEFSDRIYWDDIVYQIYTRKELKEELDKNNIDRLLSYFDGMINVCNVFKNENEDDMERYDAIIKDIDLYRNSLKAWREIFLAIARLSQILRQSMELPKLHISNFERFKNGKKRIARLYRKGQKKNRFYQL